MDDERDLGQPGRTDISAQSAPEQPASDTPDALPPGRYSRPASRGRRRAARLALAGLVVVVLAVVGWLGYETMRDPVQWKPVGFSVKGPDRIDVTFDVTKDTDATVTCTVVALSSGYAEVGVRTVTLGPSEHRTQRYTATVATQELAVTGEVNLCSVVTSGG